MLKKKVWERKANSASSGSAGAAHFLVIGARFASKIHPMIKKRSCTGNSLQITHFREKNHHFALHFYILFNFLVQKDLGTLSLSKKRYGNSVPTRSRPTTPLHGLSQKFFQVEAKLILPTFDFPRSAGATHSCVMETVIPAKWAEWLQKMNYKWVPKGPHFDICMGSSSAAYFLPGAKSCLLYTSDAADD